MGAILEIGVAAPRLASVPADLGRAVLGALGAALFLLIRWQDRLLERDRLAELEPRLLDDMGLDADDVAAELRRPFWRA